MATLEQQLKTLLGGDINLENQRNLCKWIERIEDGSVQPDDLVLSRPSFQDLVRHFCDQELQATSRRWTGLLLFKLINKSPCTMEQLGNLGHAMKRGLGHLLDDENEILRRLAGQVVHVAMSAGQEIEDFFTEEQATQYASVYSYPRSSQWATQFDADLSVEAYVAATVAVDKNLLHNPKDGTIICQVQEDQLYCARFPFDNEPLFLDIPIKTVQSIRYEEGKEASPNGNLLLELDYLHDNYNHNGETSRASIITLKFIWKKAGGASTSANDLAASQEAKDLMAVIKPLIKRDTQQASKRQSNPKVQNHATRDTRVAGDQGDKILAQGRDSDHAQLKSTSTVKKPADKTRKSDSQASTASSTSASSRRTARASKYLNVSDSSPAQGSSTRRETSPEGVTIARENPRIIDSRVNAIQSDESEERSQPSRKLRHRLTDEIDLPEIDQQSVLAPQEAGNVSQRPKKMRDRLRDAQGNLPKPDEQVASTSKGGKVTYSKKLKSPAKAPPTKSNIKRTQELATSADTNFKSKGKARAGKDKRSETTMNTFDLPDEEDDDVPQPKNSTRRPARPPAKRSNAESKSTTSKVSSESTSNANRPSARRSTRTSMKSGTGTSVYKDASDSDIENDDFTAETASVPSLNDQRQILQNDRSKPATHARKNTRDVDDSLTRDRAAQLSMAAAKSASAAEDAQEGNLDEDHDDNDLNAAMSTSHQESKKPTTIEETQNTEDQEKQPRTRLPARIKAAAPQSYEAYHETVTSAPAHRAPRSEVMPRMQNADDRSLPHESNKPTVISFTPGGPANQGTKRLSITQGRSEIPETQQVDEEPEAEYAEQSRSHAMVTAHNTLLHEAHVVENAQQEDEGMRLEEDYSDVEAEEVHGPGYSTAPSERMATGVEHQQDAQASKVDYETARSQAIGLVVSQAKAKSGEISQEMYSDVLRQGGNVSDEADDPEATVLENDSMGRDAESTTEQPIANDLLSPPQANNEEDTLDLQLMEVRAQQETYLTDSGQQLVNELLANELVAPALNTASQAIDDNAAIVEAYRDGDDSLARRDWSDYIEPDEDLASNDSHCGHGGNGDTCSDRRSEARGIYEAEYRKAKRVVKLALPATIDPGVLSIAPERMATAAHGEDAKAVVVNTTDDPLAMGAAGTVAERVVKRLATDTVHIRQSKRLKHVKTSKVDDIQNTERSTHVTGHAHSQQHTHEDEDHDEDDEDELAQEAHSPIQQHDSQPSTRVAPNGSPLPLSRQASSQVTQSLIPHVHITAATQTLVHSAENDSQGFTSKRKNVVFSEVVQEQQTSEILARPTIASLQACLPKSAAPPKQKDVSQDPQETLPKGTKPASFQHVEPQNVPEAVLDPRRRPPEPLQRNHTVDETAARQASVALAQSQAARPKPQAVAKAQKSQAASSAVFQPVPAMENGDRKSLLESAKAEVRSVPIEDPFGPPLAAVKQRNNELTRSQSHLKTDQDDSGMLAIPRASQMPPRTLNRSMAGLHAVQQIKQNSPSWQQNRMTPITHVPEQLMRGAEAAGGIGATRAADRVAAPDQDERHALRLKSNHHTIRNEPLQQVLAANNTSTSRPALASPRQVLERALRTDIQALEPDLANKILDMIMQWARDDQLSELHANPAALRAKVSEAKTLYLEDRHKRREVRPEAAPPLTSFQQRLRQATAAPIATALMTAQRVNTINWDDDEPTLVDLPVHEPQSPIATRGHIHQPKYFSSDQPSEPAESNDHNGNKRVRKSEDIVMTHETSSLGQISDDDDDDSYDSEDDGSPTLIDFPIPPGPIQPPHEAALTNSLNAITSAYTGTIFSHTARTIDLLVAYEAGGIDLIDELARCRHEEVATAEEEFGLKRQELAKALSGVKEGMEKDRTKMQEVKSWIDTARRDAQREVKALEEGLALLEGLC